MLRKALALVVGIAVLAVIVPLGLLAVACVTVIAAVVLVVWAMRRALAQGTSAAPQADAGERAHVRIRTPNEA